MEGEEEAEGMNWLDVIIRIYKSMFWHDFNVSSLYIYPIIMIMSVAWIGGFEIEHSGTFQTWVWGSILLVFLYVFLSNILKKDNPPSLTIAYVLLFVTALTQSDLILLSCGFFMILVCSSAAKMIYEIIIAKKEDE